jgi:pre-rRNA-processing protein TSR2
MATIHQAEFRAGVTACLRSWSALKTAVDLKWGGHDSPSKAEAMRQYIYDNFGMRTDGTAVKPVCSLEIFDLEDFLAITMEEDFSVTLEDSSEVQVAQLVFQMHQECAQGNYATARGVVHSCLSAQAQLAGLPVQIQSVGDDEDDDTVMEDTDMDTSDVGDAATNATDTPIPVSNIQQQQHQQPVLFTGTAQEYADQPLFGGLEVRSQREAPPVRQLGDSAPEPIEPEVDEDGFAPIVKRKGRR